MEMKFFESHLLMLYYNLLDALLAPSVNLPLFQGKVGFGNISAMPWHFEFLLLQNEVLMNGCSARLQLQSFPLRASLTDASKFNLKSVLCYLTLSIGVCAFVVYPNRLVKL